ncbi:MAG: phage holin family protein [Patescibacteria group bacterium]
MKFLLNLIVSTLSVLVAAYILPGVVVSTVFVALVVAIVFGVLNAVVKPLLMFLTLPFNILTLGLFTFVVNAVLVMLASAVVPGFGVDGFLYALLFSLVTSLVSSFLATLVK